LPPELPRGVPYFSFGLFKIPFTVAWPDLFVWITMAVVVVTGMSRSAPRTVKPAALWEHPGHDQ
jgi:hypothetical protein